MICLSDSYRLVFRSLGRSFRSFHHACFTFPMIYDRYYGANTWSCGSLTTPLGSFSSLVSHRSWQTDHTNSRAQILANHWLWSRFLWWSPIEQVAAISGENSANLCECLSQGIDATYMHGTPKEGTFHFATFPLQSINVSGRHPVWNLYLSRP